jgi:beta-galactosidase
MMREKVSFDDGWLFRRGDIPIRYAVKAGMTGGVTDIDGIRQQGEWLDIAYVDKDNRWVDDGWAAVQLPHDWCVEGNYVNDPDAGSRPGSHGYLPSGIGCYRKRFDIPERERGQRMTLHFDGVTGRSTVWVNGHLVGERFGGNTSFRYDISDVLRYGSEGDNIVLVKVDATDHEGWWYEGAGIYRHVWLQSADPLHVADWGTYVSIPDHSDCESVRVKTRIRNDSADHRFFEFRTIIVEKQSGLVAAESIGQCSAGSWEETELEQWLTVPNPRLWSPEHPFLYQVISEIWEGGRLTDRYETNAGIRTVAFDAERGFLLNGAPYAVKGTCNHQDFAGCGAAVPDAVLYYKLKLLKEMGCNAYRCAHHPPAPELLDWCDEHGMLVMDENRMLDSSARGIEELKSMLVRDRNHPSVILWGLENEEVLEGTATGTRILTTLSGVVRSIDPTRPTTAAMNHGWNDNGYGDAVDVVGYNYGHRGTYAEHHVLYPDRLMFGSEAASYLTTRGIYVSDPRRGYCSSYGTDTTSWGCSPEVALSDAERYPFLGGMFLWTGFDYRGEPTPYEWPCINSHSGMMDTCGFPKDIYFGVQAAWTEKPLVHVMPHWNWQGHEGKPIDVWVYGNCETVELFLNGRSLGEREADRPFHTEWKVAYEPGELMAVGRRGGNSAAECVRVTAGSACGIRLETDRSAIRQDGKDAAVVRVAIIDAQGNVVPDADHEIVFEVEGTGRLYGVGNGNPSSHEPDKANRRRAFNGLCLAIVQSDGREGGMTLRASSPGLAESALAIRAGGEPT